MPLSGRVGRHTKLGGKHCQNSPNDQKTVIELLNKIPVASGGTAGALNPSIIDGMASQELYLAIVAFENRYFPGQNSGYIDPDGKMFWKIVEVVTVATAPVVPVAPASPPAPPATPKPPERPPVDYHPPDVSTDDRMLKEGEKKLLRPIFKDTFPYDDQQIGANTSEWGGHTNSITPRYLPGLAMSIWRWDFSTADDTDKGIFVHEMFHAWQWYHGRNNILSGAKLWMRYGSDYDQAYFYNFDDESDFFDFNFEQQASIVEDYWFVTQGLVPRSNKGMRASLATYEQYMAQVWAKGPPKRGPYRDKSKDWRMQRHTP